MERSKVTVFFAVAAALAVAACVDSGPKHTPTPDFYMKNVKGYAETAAGPPPETVLGWDLDITGDVARWRECTGAVDADLRCGHVERSRSAHELIAVERLTELDVDGRRAFVLKLSLAARPKYITPNWKPPR